MLPYLQELSALFPKIVVTDHKGSDCSISEGIDKAVDLLWRCASAGGKIILIGNGGSASIASHIAIDLWKNAGIRAIAFNDAPLLTCISNDFGYPYVFEKPIQMFADRADVLIAISSSGRSENILKGVDVARGRGLQILTMSGFRPENPLRKLGDLNFYVPNESYGYVEIVHLSLCHCICDIIAQSRT